ncbi:MAG TPA: hypothetical protein VK978_01095 [Candidatus Saccharimonadales bacterium]|nr:hypothetical protein [Candidatus Saccharimonadales bacterium]
MTKPYEYQFDVTNLSDSGRKHIREEIKDDGQIASITLKPGRGQHGSTCQLVVTFNTDRFPADRIDTCIGMRAANIQERIDNKVARERRMSQQLTSRR